MSQDSLELRSNPSIEEFIRSPKRPKHPTARHYEVDGIDEEKRDFLPRESLVNFLIEGARENGLLVIRSPPGTGKTSALSLLKGKIKEQNETTIGFILRPPRPQKEGFDL